MSQNTSEFQAYLRQQYNAYLAYMGVAMDEIIDEGVKLGEIEAWRCWRYESHRRVCSTAVPITWSPGEPMQADLCDWLTFRGGHGIHAHRQKKQALNQARAMHCPAIVGRVHMWGVIVEHEHGYRAEFAKPIAFVHFTQKGEIQRGNKPLFRPRQRHRILQQLDKEYGL